MASFYKYQTPQDPIACRIGTITRDAGIASLLKEICMREMTKEEMSQVSGAGFSDYVGAVVGAVCAASCTIEVGDPHDPVQGTYSL